MNQLGTIILNTEDISPSTSNIYDTTLETDALLHMPMSDSVIDDTKSATDATNVNSVTLQTYQYPYTSSNDTKTGALFDRSASRYIELSPNIGNFNTASVCTVSFFLYVASAVSSSSKHGIVGFKNSATDGNIVEVYYSENKIWFKATEESRANVFRCYINIVLEEKSWHHIAFQFGTSGIKICYGGVNVTDSNVVFEVGDKNSTFGFDDTTPDTSGLGCMYSNTSASADPAGNGYSDQVLSDVFIFDRALTNTEINVLFENSFQINIINGNMNASRSSFTFNNIDVRRCIGDYYWNKYDTFFFKILGQKYTDGSPITSGNDKNVDIYVMGLPLTLQQLNVNGMDSEIYLHSVRSDFNNGFVVDPDEFLNDGVEIEKSNYMTLVFSYKDIDGRLLPVQTSSDIYPHTLFKIGIYA